MLGVDLSAQESAADRALRLHDHLQAVTPRKPILFVLDDDWTWEDLAPLRGFAEPGNALLVTTRDLQLARRFTQRRPSTVQELDETRHAGGTCVTASRPRIRSRTRRSAGTVTVWRSARATMSPKTASTSSGWPARRSW